MSNGQAENSLHENAIGWGIMLVIIVILLWILWYFQQENIRDMVRWIRYSQMWFISQLVDDSYMVVHNGRELSWQASYQYILDQGFNKNQLAYEHLSLFSSMAMKPLKVTFVIILGAMGLWAMFYGPGTSYRQKLGLEGLIERQAGNFPVIAPFVEANPSKMPSRAPGSPVPAELPAFSEALGPEEWVAYFEVPVPDGKLDKEAAAKQFQRQLVGRWKGAKALKPYQQVLLAAFCLKAARKRDQSDDMLGRLALCWSLKKGLQLGKDRTLVKEARKILADKKLAGGTLQLCNRHAFVTTALMRGLKNARDEGGVLAPAQFVWLRAHDRALWYPLNNLGRQSFHMEALGAMTHFKAERMTQRPIPVPKMENAVETLEEYLSSSIARPIPQLDYSGSTKRGVKKAL